MRFQYVLSVFLFLVADAAYACEIHSKKAGTPELVHCPDDVNVFINRAFMCQHFAGEINGDHSLRDQQVQEQFMKLKCNGLKVDYERMLKKYAADADVVQVMQKTIDDDTIDLY
jgi:hypothetical protein